MAPQVASRLGPKIWRLPDGVVLRGEQGTRDGKEEMVTGTGTAVGTGGRIFTGISTRVAMGVRMGEGMENGAENGDKEGGETRPGNLQSKVVM